ncbi:hypothetical protein F4604DRAFT_1681337 [Suillus subluteus]|nr:hypothetical protein F4604DRAFT_1681337 [Suillus subluteus]
MSLVQYNDFNSCHIMYNTCDWMDEVVAVMLGIIVIAQLHAMYQRSRKMLIFLVVVFLAIRITNAVMIPMLTIQTSGVWIAVKHFRELQQHSTGGIIKDCFTVLMQTHVSYFARSAFTCQLAAPYTMLLLALAASTLAPRGMLKRLMNLLEDSHFLSFVSIRLDGTMDAKTIVNFPQITARVAQYRKWLGMMEAHAGRQGCPSDSEKSTFGMYAAQ